MLDWFTTIPGILIISGVVLLVIAVVLFVKENKAESGKKEAPKKKEPEIKITEPIPVEVEEKVEEVVMPVEEKEQTMEIKVPTEENDDFEIEFKEEPEEETKVEEL